MGTVGYFPGGEGVHALTHTAKVQNVWRVVRVDYRDSRNLYKPRKIIPDYTDSHFRRQYVSNSITDLDRP